MSRLALDLLSAAILLSGCGFGYGFVRDAATVQRVDYQVPVAKMKYLRTVSGSAVKRTLFGAIPLDDDQYLRASRALFESAALTENTTILNLREDHTVRNFIFYAESKLTLSGDVFEFKH
jgi:hypothetical protein